MRFDLNKLTRGINKVGRMIKNISPELFIVGGTVGLVVAGVIACKETPKAMKKVEEHKDKISTVEKCFEHGVNDAGDTYTEEDYHHDKAIIFVQDGFNIIKTYSPALILATLSVTAIFAGGKIFRHRITTITSAYALLENSFSKYREGVIDKFGKEIDKELRYKITNETSQERENDTSEDKTEKRSGYDGYSDYARFFDETNPNWVKDGGRNLAFITDQQSYANYKLKLQGALFLNEVYDLLGIPRSPQGQLVGWIYNPDNDTIDNYVDFGITDILRNKSNLREVMKNEERSFLLDFNCDGRILESFTKFSKYKY